LIHDDSHAELLCNDRKYRANPAHMSSQNHCAEAYGKGKYDAAIGTLPCENPRVSICLRAFAVLCR
jgi:hypothetical protein